MKPSERKGYDSPQKNRRDFIIGFGGWWLVNVLIGGMAYFTDPFSQSILICLSFPLNLLGLIFLIFTRQWMALGVLVAIAVNILISLILGLFVNAICFSPFVFPLE